MILNILLQLRHHRLHFLDLLARLCQLLLVHHGLAEEEFVASIVASEHAGGITVVILVLGLLVHVYGFCLTVSKIIFIIDIMFPII